MADLVVHPRETVEFDEFSSSPGPAIALDGYVAGPTRFTCDHVNFNHHEEVDRFATRATCEQVALALRMHLPLLHRPTLSVHVNDPDPDVCFSVWLLNHPDAVDEPAIERICTLEGAIDASGGTCLPGSSDDIDTLAWVIEPWASRRAEMASLAATDMASVIAAVGARLDALRSGTAGRIDMAASYEIVTRLGDVWAIVEHHPLARARAVADGAAVFIAARTANHRGRYSVTIGKASPFVDFELEECYRTLNELECAWVTPTDRWGGSDLVGGSPRGAGTALPLGAIAAVIASVRDATASRA